MQVVLQKCPGPGYFLKEDDGWTTYADNCGSRNFREDCALHRVNETMNFNGHPSNVKQTRSKLDLNLLNADSFL